MPPTFDNDHKGPLLNVAAYILIVVAGVLGIAKIGIKWRMTSTLHLDDAFMGLSIVFAAGATAAANMQVSLGLGSHVEGLDSTTIESFQKAVFATDILFVATIFLAKMSLVRFLRNFTLNESYLGVIDIYLYALGTWTFIAIMCVSFRCKLPQPWEFATDRCYNLNVFWTINAAVDVISQLILAFLPAYLLRRVRIAAVKKKIAIAAYVPIVTTIPFEILRIVALWTSNPFVDVTWQLYQPSLYTILHANYAVIASCSTFLIPIVDALSVGQISSKVGMIPVSNNPHIRRASAPLSSLIIIGGQNFLVTTPSSPDSRHRSLASSPSSPFARGASTASSANSGQKSHAVGVRDPDLVELQAIDKLDSRGSLISKPEKVVLASCKPVDEFV